MNESGVNGDTKNNSWGTAPGTGRRGERRRVRSMVPVNNWGSRTLIFIFQVLGPRKRTSENRTKIRSTTRSWKVRARSGFSVQEIILHGPKTIIKILKVKRFSKKTSNG